MKDVRECFNKIIAEGQCYSIKQLNINGKNLMELGCRQGSMIGEGLEMLLDDVINDRCKNSKEELVRQYMEWKV